MLAQFVILGLLINWTCLASFKTVPYVPNVHSSEASTFNLYFPYTECSLRASDAGHASQAGMADLVFGVLQSPTESLSNGLLTHVSSKGILSLYTISRNPFQGAPINPIKFVDGKLRLSVAIELALKQLILPSQISIYIPSPELPIQYQILNAAILIQYVRYLSRGEKLDPPFLFLETTAGSVDCATQMNLALVAASDLLQEESIRDVHRISLVLENEVDSQSQCNFSIKIYSTQSPIDAHLLKISTGMFHTLFPGVAIDRQFTDDIEITIYKVLDYLKSEHSDVFGGPECTLENISYYALMDWISSSTANSSPQPRPASLTMNTHFNRLNEYYILSFWKHPPLPRALHQLRNLFSGVIKALFVRFICLTKKGVCTRIPHGNNLLVLHWRRSDSSLFGMSASDKREPLYYIMHHIGRMWLGSNNVVDYVISSNILSSLSYVSDSFDYPNQYLLFLGESLEKLYKYISKLNIIPTYALPDISSMTEYNKILNAALLAKYLLGVFANSSLLNSAPSLATINDHNPKYHFGRIRISLMLSSIILSLHSKNFACKYSHVCEALASVILIIDKRMKILVDPVVRGTDALAADEYDMADVKLNCVAVAEARALPVHSNSTSNSDLFFPILVNTANLKLVLPEYYEEYGKTTVSGQLMSTLRINTDGSTAQIRIYKSALKKEDRQLTSPKKCSFNGSILSKLVLVANKLLALKNIPLIPLAVTLHSNLFNLGLVTFYLRLVASASSSAATACPEWHIDEESDYVPLRMILALRFCMIMCEISVDPKCESWELCYYKICSHIINRLERFALETGRNNNNTSQSDKMINDVDLDLNNNY